MCLALESHGVEGVVPRPVVLLMEGCMGCDGNAKEVPVTFSRASRVKFKSFYLAHHDLVSQPPRPSTSPAGTQSLFPQRPRIPALRRLQFGLGAQGVGLWPEGPRPRTHVSLPTFAISRLLTGPLPHLQSVLPANPGPPVRAFIERPSRRGEHGAARTPVDGAGSGGGGA